MAKEELAKQKMRAKSRKQEAMGPVMGIRVKGESYAGYNLHERDPKW